MTSISARAASTVRPGARRPIAYRTPRLRCMPAPIPFSRKMPASSRPTGVHTSAPGGNSNAGGMTPTTVNGSRRAPTGTDDPTTSGSPSKNRRHAAWPSTIARSASAPSSAGRNARPSRGCAPSVSKNDAETALMVNRIGGSCWTSTSPHVVEPIAAMAATERACARQSSKFGRDTSMCGLPVVSSFSHRTTRSSWSANGMGSSRTASTTAKRPTAIPRPRARVSVAATRKPGCLRWPRIAWRRSWRLSSAHRRKRDCRWSMPLARGSERHSVIIVRVSWNVGCRTVA